MSDNSAAKSSAIWKNHVSIPDTPDGFTLRTTYPTNADGVEVMLEKNGRLVLKSRLIHTPVMI